ncbi:MAG: RsbRD N-terminal domain-containing protein [Candidatus Riflebacteria bacterium]|nr:RsbRD N-terminal domain-containing protein [Candidatus Riflebacteria bacterium]
MTLESLLLEKRADIVRGWIDRTLALFPASTGVFLRTTEDRFDNPVGEAIFSHMGPLFDALLENAPREAVEPHLDPIVQIRSIQDCSASEALSFVFLLKDVLRQEAGDALHDSRGEPLREFDGRIDRLALLAFDRFIGFKQKVYEIRIKEIKNSVSTLLKMSNLTCDDPK